MLETLVLFPLTAAFRALFGPLLAALAAAFFVPPPAPAPQPIPASVAEQAETGLQEAAAPAPAAKALAPFRFEPAPGRPVVEIPLDERLTYQVFIDIAFIKTSVGHVIQTCRVEPERATVLLPAQGESGTIRLDADGGALGYKMKSEIETRLRRRDWPRIQYSTTTEGKKLRRREVLMGVLDGALTSSYRSDTDKNAPEGTTIWREAKLRPVPEGTIDMLSAILLTRHLIREDVERLTFPLLDKDRVWAVELSRGHSERMRTPAGSFDVVEVVLAPRPYPGEDFDEKAKKRFEGVFGIRGSIHLWVDRRTGVTVRIQGDLPVGRLTFGVDVTLDSYAGTPEGFGPVD